MLDDVRSAVVEQPVGLCHGFTKLALCAVTRKSQNIMCIDVQRYRCCGMIVMVLFGENRYLDQSLPVCKHRLDVQTRAYSPVALNAGTKFPLCSNSPFR